MWAAWNRMSSADREPHRSLAAQRARAWNAAPIKTVRPRFGQHLQTRGRPTRLARRGRPTPVGARGRRGCFARSLAADAQVQVAVVVEDLLEAAGHQGVLLADLADVGPLHELQRLRPAVWQRLRGAQQRLPLVEAVAQRQNVPRPAAALLPVDAHYLRLEGAQLPLQRRRHLGGLVRCPRRQELDVLQDGQQRRQELRAAELDPATLRICNQHHLAVLLRGGERLGGRPRDLRELLPLRRREAGAAVQPQALPLHPRGRQHGVVPVEDEDGVLGRAREPAGGPLARGPRRRRVSGRAALQGLARPGEPPARLRAQRRRGAHLHLLGDAVGLRVAGGGGEVRTRLRGHG
mmetsp:Transcript_60169/g.162191  ORF Transcript_60169/g.162191 Transcript_60169/m.162191 type:complete len:349 (+) Transcript_60169:70-1116(+)